MARLYTECLWKIQLDNKQNAIHELSFKVFNVTEWIPSIEECIELRLPPNMSFESWDTEVEGISLGPGYGPEEENIYRLKFRDIEDISTAPEMKVKVSFNQKQAVMKIGNVNIFDLNIGVKFYSNSIQVSVCLPEVVAWWRKFLSNAFSLLRRKKFFKYYEIEFFGHTPRMDDESGRLIYQHRKVLPVSGIVYKSIGIAYIVVGILSVILERVLEFLWRLIF